MCELNIIHRFNDNQLLQNAYTCSNGGNIDFNKYDNKECDLAFACKEAATSNADFMYFADTHGGLDLGENLELFKQYTKLIKGIGLIPGLHLHDHSGKAYFNYRNLVEAGFDATDVSLGGLAKLGSTTCMG